MPEDSQRCRFSRTEDDQPTVQKDVGRYYQCIVYCIYCRKSCRAAKFDLGTKARVNRSGDVKEGTHEVPGKKQEMVTGDGDHICFEGTVN